MRREDEERQSVPGSGDAQQQDRELYALPDARWRIHRTENRGRLGALPPSAVERRTAFVGCYGGTKNEAHETPRNNGGD
jgi:hypothetical protein